MILLYAIFQHIKSINLSMACIFFVFNKLTKFCLYLDRQPRIAALLQYSSSLSFLLCTMQTYNELSQFAFESLLSDERGFQGRLLIFQVASKSRDLSRLNILKLCEISTLHENKITNRFQ